MNRNPFLGLTALLAVVAACGGTQATNRPVPVGSHFVITEAELQAAQDRTLFELIQRIRPTFLRSRQVQTTTTTNPEPVHVYVDGQRTEGLDVLRRFSPQLVHEVRFYEPQEANVRFGTGHHGGLIAVTLNH